MYVNDNKTSLPFPNWGGHNFPGWLYMDPLPNPLTEDYVSTGCIYQYLNNTTVYHCPKDDPPFTSGPTENLTNFLMNGETCETNLCIFHKITDFHATDVLFWETEEALTSGAPWNDGSSFPGEAGITNRHMADHGASVGCMDGHVEWWSKADYSFHLTQQPGPLFCNPATANGV